MANEHDKKHEGTHAQEQVAHLTPKTGAHEAGTQGVLPKPPDGKPPGVLPPGPPSNTLPVHPGAPENPVTPGTLPSAPGTPTHPIAGVPERDPRDEREPREGATLPVREQPGTHASPPGTPTRPSGEPLQPGDTLPAARKPTPETEAPEIGVKSTK